LLARLLPIFLACRTRRPRGKGGTIRAHADQAASTSSAVAGIEK
jgi:hypothetical protein